MSEHLKYGSPDQVVWNKDRFRIPDINAIYPEVVLSGSPRVDPREWQYDGLGRITTSTEYHLTGQIDDEIERRQVEVVVSNQGGAIEKYQVNGRTIIDSGPRSSITADDQARKR